MAFSYILWSPWQLIVAAVASYCLYGACLVIHRIYLSPLARFPGPKLAAATDWYEFYYQVCLGGKYIYQIEKMHQRYGTYNYIVLA